MVKSTPLAVVASIVLAGAAYASPRSMIPDKVQFGPTTEALHMQGVIAYTQDGTELGEVTRTKIGDHGDVSEVHITMAEPMGIGGKTVAVPMARCITLRGAVVVEMPLTEVARLPAVDDIGNRRRN